jgi:hypothetical protein
MIAHNELESFEDLGPIIKNIANPGNERFFRMDVKPDYGDTLNRQLPQFIFLCKIKGSKCLFPSICTLVALNLNATNL